MMFYSGAAVTLDFALETEPDTIGARVEDQDGELIGTPLTGVEISVDGLIARVTIPSAVNTLQSGQMRGHRIVQVTYLSDTFAGSKVLEQDYGLHLNQPLISQLNSFQGYNEALMTAADMVGLNAFTAASRDERIVALQNAWVDLCRLNYSFERENDQTRIHDAPGGDTWNLSEVTAEEFAGFPDRFKRALRRAQVVAADDLLAGGGAAQKRLDGILSSTIGETSQMFRIGKPVTYATSPRALRELRGYVSFAVRLARGG